MKNIRCFGTMSKPMPQDHRFEIAEADKLQTTCEDQ